MAYRDHTFKRDERTINSTLAQIKAILEQGGFHYDQVDLLDATGEDVGALTEIAEEAAVVQPIIP